MNTQTAARNGRFEGLRILGFCDYYTTASSGGAEKVTAEVYQRLIAEGAEVMVISAIPKRHLDEASPDGVPTRVVPGLDLAGVLNAQVMVAPRLLSAARKVSDKFGPHVVHASSIHFQGSFVAALHSRRHRLPLVTTGHLGSIAALPALTRAATNVYEQTIGRFVLSSSQRVIAVSDAAALHLRRLGAKEATTSVVPNGVDHLRFLPGEKRNEAPHVVFIGRLIQNKGPDDALAAFAAVRTPGTHLTFVGDGPMRAHLEASAGRLGLRDSVRFAGHVADVSPIVRAADVLIRPSLTEGQSLAILEAMAAGVCVLASDIPANRELIDPGESGLLAGPGDTRDIARQLGMLLSDASLRNRLAARGRERSLEHSWDTCAQETGAILAEAASRQPEYR